jgi:4,5-DOPA dioxygenase extradiol
MNAITDNPYRHVWRTLGRALPRPQAILCVSAHWLTHGTFVTVTERPKTIHDFYGFPQELFAQRYPAPGALNFARLTMEAVTSTTVQPNAEWGLDHGAWSVLQSLYPDANVPVFQLSIDFDQPPQYHLELARELASLRERGVLILDSGNVVHNLRTVRPGAQTPDWALEFDTFVKERIEEENLVALAGYEQLSTARMAVPTNDHYLPMLYAAAVRRPKDNLSFFTEEFDMGSLSMRSFLLG